MGTQSLPPGFKGDKEQAEWDIAWSKYRAGVPPYYEDPGVLEKYSILQQTGPKKYYEFLQSLQSSPPPSVDGKVGYYYTTGGTTSAQYSSEIQRYIKSGYSQTEAQQLAAYSLQTQTSPSPSKVNEILGKEKITITDVPAQVLTPQARATQQFQEQQTKAKTFQPLPFMPTAKPVQQQGGIILTPAGRVAAEGAKTLRDVWSGGLGYGYVTTPTTKTKEEVYKERDVLSKITFIPIPKPIVSALQTVYMRREGEQRLADIKRQEVSRERISKELTTAEESIQKWKDYEFKTQEEYDEYLKDYEKYQNKIQSAKQRLQIVGFKTEDTETGFTIKGLEPPKSIYQETLERGTTAEKVGVGLMIFGGKAIETYALVGLAGPVIKGVSATSNAISGAISGAGYVKTAQVLGTAGKIGGQVAIGGATGLFLGLEGGQAVKGYVEYGPWGLTKPIAEVSGVAGGLGLRYLTAPVTRTKVTYDKPKSVGTSEPKIVEFQGKTIDKSLQQYTIKSSKTTTTSETNRFRELFGQKPLTETSKTIYYTTKTPGKFVGGEDYLTLSYKKTDVTKWAKAKGQKVSGGQQQIDIKNIAKLSKTEQYAWETVFKKVPGGYKEGDILLRGEPVITRLTEPITIGKTTQSFISATLARQTKVTEAGIAYKLWTGTKDITAAGAYARASGNIPILESGVFIKTPTTTQLNIPTGVTTKGYELPGDLKSLVLGNLMSGQAQATQLTIPIISQQLAGKTLLTTAAKQISPGELVGGTIGTIAGLQTKETTKTKYFPITGIITKPTFEQKTETTTKEGTGGLIIPYSGQVGIIMPSETTREVDKLITFQPVEERQDTNQKQPTGTRQRFFFPFTPYTPEATVGYYGWPPIVPFIAIPGMPKLGGYTSQKYGGKTKKRKFKYTPTLVGVFSGKVIKKPLKGTLTGGEIRYPIAEKKKKGKTSLKNIFGV